MSEHSTMTHPSSVALHSMVHSSIELDKAVVHAVKVFGIVNKTEIDVFLELPCFFNDPADVGNLITGSSASS